MVQVSLLHCLPCTLLRILHVFSYLNSPSSPLSPLHFCFLLCEMFELSKIQLQNKVNFNCQYFKSINFARAICARFSPSSAPEFLQNSTSTHRAMAPVTSKCCKLNSWEYQRLALPLSSSSGTVHGLQPHLRARMLERVYVCETSTRVQWPALGGAHLLSWLRNSDSLYEMPPKKKEQEKPVVEEVTS